MKNSQAAALAGSGQKRKSIISAIFIPGALRQCSALPLLRDLFMKLLEKQPEASPASPAIFACCLEWRKIVASANSSACLNHKLVAQWLRSQATLCTIHGTKLKQGVPPVIASTIQAIMERYRKQLIGDLESLRDEYQPDTANWGLLGHAAEFLVSQRGLHT